MIVSGIRWQFKAYKRITTENKVVVDLALECLNVKSRSCEAFAIFKLLSNETNKVLVAKKLPKKVFNERFQLNKLDGFISWNEIDPNKKCIDQGRIRFDVEILADPVNADSSDQIEIKCTHSTLKIVIGDPINMKSLSSERVVIRDLEWWVQLRREDDYFGIFLCCDHEKIPAKWSYNVEAKFKMLAANDDKVLKEMRYKRDFRVGLYDWGFEKFISSDELLKATSADIWLKHAYFEAEIKVDAAKPLWNYDDDLQGLIDASISKCPICLESFSKCQVSSTKCGHLFCIPCITTVIEQHKKCSICSAAAEVKDLRSIFIS